MKAILKILATQLTVLPLTLCLGVKIDRSGISVASIPDNNKMTADFIEKYGYPAESHEVPTEDGYILTIHRIPYSIKDNTTDRPVVLLQHGIVLSSDQWVLQGRHDLVFQLSDQGYDVWLGNTRGTFYSKHKVYSSKDYKFWNYSLHESGYYDLAAMIDYLLDVTGRPYLSYIGHSRGNAMAVILLSERPQYNRKINLFLSLAPVMYSKQARCPLYEIAGNRPTSLMRTATLERALTSGKIGNLLYTNKPIRSILSTVCRPGSLMDNVCPIMFFFINGEDFKMFNKSLVPVILSHFTMGVGAKELVHLLQISESDIFRQYDYGRKENVLRYRRKSPPEYKISNVKVPSYIYYGPNDLFVSERDLKKYAKQLPNYRGVYRIPYEKFNHLDYIWARNSQTLLYPRLIKTLNLYNNIKSS